GTEVRVHARILGLVPDVDAQLGAAALQDLQQRQASDAGEAVPGRLQQVALVLDVDVVPVREVGRDVAMRRLVGGEQVAERLVGQHDAEAERVVGAVALDDVDARAREGLLQQDRGIQAGGSSADDVDAHEVSILATRGCTSFVKRTRLRTNCFKFKVIFRRCNRETIRCTRPSCSPRAGPNLAGTRTGSPRAAPSLPSPARSDGTRAANSRPTISSARYARHWPTCAPCSPRPAAAPSTSFG